MSPRPSDAKVCAVRSDPFHIAAMNSTTPITPAAGADGRVASLRCSPDSRRAARLWSSTGWALGLSMLVAAVPPAFAEQPAYEEHVLFDNAPASGPYYHSETYLVAPSTMAIVNGHIPVQSQQFVSPPNGLRLQWKSAPGGDWQWQLKDPGRDWRTYELAGDTLAFWCFSDTEITAGNSPRVFMQDRNKVGTPSLTLVKGDATIPANQWFQVRLPFGVADPETKGTSDNPFELRNAVSLTFTQGLDDNVEHTLYVDDFMIINGSTVDREAPEAPAGLTVRPYERHFDIAWSPSSSVDVLAYRIHRSLDGKNFTPVGTQRNAWHRYADFVDAPGATASYRVSAVDLAGNESPLSEASTPVATRALSDDELLDMVQLACFRYYWEAGHANAGLAPEILPGDDQLIATGGNGFGIMALLVAIERKFITREQGIERMQKILRFLAVADRFHGVWPHFLDGRTGKTIPFFGRYDNGGDLVETAFVIQGLLAARQFFDQSNPAEREIRDTITRFWHEVEWDWYRKDPDSDVLYWHWSPDHEWHIGHPLIGWNETMIVYLLAIASPTHAVPAELYHGGWAGQSPRHVDYRQGWGRTTAGDRYTNGNAFFGITLDVGVGNGGELFFTHFSFMGFDPRNLRDRYTNYFENNRNIALIHRAYGMENPRGFVGYGPDCWGRSAGINSGGGRALPRDDNGTINCMAALSSMPYTPAESMAALRHFYRKLGEKVWGTFGFHDGFNETQNWFDEDYMALNQAPIVVMIENHRSGLVWKKFMANPKIAPALKAIGFKSDGR
jgi:exo beta-1,2-glucooligosaccharide sophorohydrolase (non-reducing end)